MLIVKDDIHFILGYIANAQKVFVLQEGNSGSAYRFLASTTWATARLLRIKINLSATGSE